MTDENLIPILSVVYDISEEFPSLRFGKILQTAIDMEYRSHNNNLLDRSSKQILYSLSNYQIYLRRDKKWQLEQ